MGYTIHSEHGCVQMGLTLDEAVHELLSADGYRYEWRMDDDGYVKLYTSHHSANSSGGSGTLSPTHYAGYNLDEIMKRIIEQRWHGLCASLDADYAAWEIEAELGL